MPGTASGLPEPVEDAVQFFLYRVQVGAALAGDRLTAEEIGSLLGPPPRDPDSLRPRLLAALAAAWRREGDQARNAARKAAALGEAHDPPRDAWRRQRAVLLAGAPASRLREAVGAFE